MGKVLCEICKKNLVDEDVRIPWGNIKRVLTKAQMVRVKENRKDDETFHVCAECLWKIEKNKEIKLEE